MISKRADILGGQGALDATQAATSAGVAQGVRETNAAAKARAAKSERDAYSGLAQTAVSMLSSGGTVPGTPEVMGDSPRNDTVEANIRFMDLVE